MKKRRSAIVAFLLVAVFCLGIGFAALSDDLFVDAVLNYKESESDPVFQEDVYFSAVSVTAQPENVQTGKEVEAEIVDDDNGGTDDKVLITVPAGAFTYVGETATIKASVKNDSPEAVKIAVTTVGPLSDTDGVFSVTCVVNEADATIAANGEGANIVTITIELTKRVESLENAKLTFTLSATTAN